MKGGEGEETFLKKSGPSEGKENMRLERGIWSFVYKSEEIIEKRTMGRCPVEDHPAWNRQRRVDF